MLQGFPDGPRGPAFDPRDVPSKQFDVWRRLRSRYLLEPAPPVGSAPRVGTGIQITTDGDELLKEYRIDQSPNLDLTAASGSDVVAFTVPEDERWLLTWFNKSATVANTAMSLNPGNNLSFSLLLTPLGTGLVIEPSIKLLLPPNSRINMRTTGNAGDGNAVCAVATVRETFF